MISAMSSFLTLNNLVLALFKCHSYKSWELNLSTDLPVLMFLKSRRLNSDESCWRTSLYIESGKWLSGKTVILIEQYLVWRHFIFRILPSKTKIANKMVSIKEMQSSGFRLFLRTAFIQQTLKCLIQVLCQIQRYRDESECLSLRVPV